VVAPLVYFINNPTFNLLVCKIFFLRPYYLPLRRHLPAFLHLAGVGQPAHGLNLIGIVLFGIVNILKLCLGTHTLPLQSLKHRLLLQVAQCKTVRQASHRVLACLGIEIIGLGTRCSKHPC
jgi:hypothetical protein